jgi:hypothetical protein
MGVIMTFFELTDKIEELKEQQKILNEQLDVEMAKLPLDVCFQNPSNGLVYKIQKSKGSYVYYKDLEYVRTKKATEAKVRGRGGRI